MRAFLVAFAACALVACGGKVVLDAAGVGSGGSSTGGLGGGSADGGTCAELFAQLDAAIQAAMACDPGAPTNTCTTVDKDYCGCPHLASTQGDGVTEVDAAVQALNVAGCSEPCPASCPAANPMFAQCVATSSGGICAEGPG